MTRRVDLELGPDLQEDYESWVECCRSLDRPININSFLSYIDYFGTYTNPKIDAILDE
jgi:hypothetical protein